MFDEDTIPAEDLAAAHAKAVIDSSNSGSSDEIITKLIQKGTKLGSLIEGLLGDQDQAAWFPKSGGWCQLSSVWSENPDGADWGPFSTADEDSVIGAHCDFGHNFKCCCREPPGTHPNRFDLLVGIPFAPSEMDFSGNFSVYKGSHRKVAERFRDHLGGYDGLYCTKSTQAGQRLDNAPWSTLFGLVGPNQTGDWGPPECLKVKYGQPYVAHFNTVHFVQKNYRRKETRIVAYFRLSHPASHINYDKRGFENLWMDFPRLGGCWDPYVIGQEARDMEEELPEAVFEGEHPQWADRLSFRQKSRTFLRTAEANDRAMSGAWRMFKEDHDDGSVNLVLVAMWERWGGEHLISTDGGRTFRPHPVHPKGDYLACDEHTQGLHLSSSDLPQWWQDECQSLLNLPAGKRTLQPLPENTSSYVQFFATHSAWSDGMTFDLNKGLFQRLSGDGGTWDPLRITEAADGARALHFTWSLWGEDKLTSSDGGRSLSNGQWKMIAEENPPKWWLQLFTDPIPENTSNLVRFTVTHTHWSDDMVFDRDACTFHRSSVVDGGTWDPARITRTEDGEEANGTFTMPFAWTSWGEDSVNSSDGGRVLGNGTLKMVTEENPPRWWLGLFCTD